MGEHTGKTIAFSCMTQGPVVEKRHLRMNESQAERTRAYQPDKD
jgi:hypothetical protein